MLLLFHFNLLAQSQAPDLPATCHYHLSPAPWWWPKLTGMAIFINTTFSITFARLPPNAATFAWSPPVASGYHLLFTRILPSFVCQRRQTPPSITCIQISMVNALIWTPVKRVIRLKVIAKKTKSVISVSSRASPQQQFVWSCRRSCLAFLSPPSSGSGTRLLARRVTFN